MSKRQKNQKQPKQDPKIAKLIKESIQVYASKSNNPGQSRDLQTLGAQISEFLDCFVVIGFTPDGNAVQMTLLHTPQEKSALADLIRQLSINDTSDD